MATVKGVRCYNLEAIYRGYNQKYFKGKLPSVICMWNGRETDKRKALATTLPLTGKEAKKQNALYLLVFHPSLLLDGSFISLAVLHEMAHLSVGTGRHGPKFEKEMLRIAKAGAFKKIW